MANIVDIACCGTSLTAGTGSASPGAVPYGSFAPVLATAFPQKSSHIKCYNFGSGGVISTGWISSVLPIALLMKPKIVLIEFMTNDCLGSGGGGVDTTTSIANHVTIINAFKALSTPPAIYVMSMNQMVGAGASATARSNLATYNALLPSIASGNGVTYIDNSTAYGTLNGTDVPDGVHPTMACNIAKLIPSLVSALGSSII